MSYDNTNTGVLFKNEKTSDNQPDYKGKIDVEGKEMQLAAWIRTSNATGKKFLSIKVSEPWRPKEETVEEFDDSMPF